MTFIWTGLYNEVKFYGRWCVRVALQLQINLYCLSSKPHMPVCKPLGVYVRVRVCLCEQRLYIWERSQVVVNNKSMLLFSEI